MAQQGARHDLPSLPDPSVDLVPLTEARTASVRGEYRSGCRAELDEMWEVAREHFTRALVQASPLEAQALGELIGTTFIRNGEFKAALVQFEQLLEAARSRDDRRAESRAFYNLGAARMRLGELAVCERLFEEARRLARSVPDEECLAFAENGLSAVYGFGERAQEADELKTHALMLAGDAQDSTLMARLLFGPEGGFEGVEESIEKMFRDQHAESGAHDVVLDLQLEAERAKRDGQIEKELVALRRMRMLAGSSHRPDEEASALRGLASTYIRVGDHQQALHYLRQALDITCQHEPPGVVAFAMRVYAFSVAKTGDTEGALAKLVETYRYCQKHEDIERLRETACAFIDLAEQYNFIDRLPELCMEHGLSIDEVRRIADETQKWHELYGCEETPDDDEP